MGQLLIIHDADERNVPVLLAEALDRFDRLCGLEPLDRWVAGPLAVVKFPRGFKGSTGIARAERSQRWSAGAGTWLYRGTALETALDAVSRRLARDPGGLPAVLDELDGAFALATGDGSGPPLLVTDRVGSLHVYRRRIGTAVVASTSSMVLAALGPVTWDPASCAEFLATGTVFETRTLFREIEKLGPAELHRLGDEGPGARTRYWEPGATFWDRSPRRGTVAELGRALQQGLRDVAAAFPAPVMDLTGGLDSRALLAAMLRAELSFDTVVNGAPGHPDVEAANDIARAFGLSHRHQPPAADWAARWWDSARVALSLCDGEYDVLEYARTLENHRRVAGRFDATINGSGGEFAKGYWWELLFPYTGRRRPIDERRLAAGRFATDPWSDRLRAGELRLDLVEHFAAVIARANARLTGHRNTALLDHVYLALRMQRWQGRIASATHRLWPCVSPFMLREPMELAFSAPPRTRVRNRMSRRLIEHLEPRLSRMPLAGGLPAAPLRPGTAHRYVPLAREMLGKLRRRLPGGGVAAAAPARDVALETLLGSEEVRTLLAVDRMRTRELYEPRELHRYVAAALERPAGHASQLGRILTLELLAEAVGI